MRWVLFVENKWRFCVPKYLVTYHGGDGMPSSPEARQQVMAAFGAWAASVGSALIDPGAPLTAIKTVSSNDVAKGPAGGPVSGYTVIEASNLADAVELVESHPFVQRGGPLQVSEAAGLGDA
jgi:hypothetical protein